MALKAYKHLTDGEVKIVASGSAEETSLLADTVTGSSYLQLTSTGHSQEVAAAQGTALWVDVTSDLGGGLPTGMDYQVFEETALVIPSGSTDPIAVGDPWPITRDVRGLWGGFVQVTAPAEQLIQVVIGLESDNAGSSGVSNPPLVAISKLWDWSSGEFNWSDSMWGTNQDPDDTDAVLVVRVSPAVALTAPTTAHVRVAVMLL